MLLTNKSNKKSEVQRSKNKYWSIQVLLFQENPNNYQSYGLIDLYQKISLKLCLITVLSKFIQIIFYLALLNIVYSSTPHFLIYSNWLNSCMDIINDESNAIYYLIL